jgi:hypothetical protein
METSSLANRYDGHVWVQLLDDVGLRCPVALPCRPARRLAQLLQRTARHRPDASYLTKAS